MKTSSFKLKGAHIAAFIVLLLIFDQALKFYIKTHFYLGEVRSVFGNWFQLCFVENAGMAWGLSFGGSIGKILLTFFRLVAVIGGTFYLRNLIRKKAKAGFIICVALIYAGAAGNLIDSMFYGLLFNQSYGCDASAAASCAGSVAHFLPKSGGYAGFMHGRVVDMLSLPLIDTELPNWLPVWGGTRFTFFDPVFNLADSYISVSVFILIIFQKKLFGEKSNILTD